MNIMNITSDGRVVCDQFDMSFKEFYELMIKKTMEDNELYNFVFDSDEENFFATYKGKKYRVKHDNKDLKDVVDDDKLIHYRHVMHDASCIIYGVFHKEDESDLDRLLTISAKKTDIAKYVKWVEEWEGQKKFFNKDKFLGVNDLHLTHWGIDRVNKANIGFTCVLIFCNLCGFFIPFIRELYMSMGTYFLLTFIPFFVKFYYDIDAYYNRKKRTLMSYLLYPILHICSKKNCDFDIKRLNKDIIFQNKCLDEYYEICINDLYKKEEIAEEKDTGLEERLTIEKIENNTKEEEKTEEKVNVLKKSLKR